MTSEKPGCLAAIFGVRPAKQVGNTSVSPYRLSSQFFTPAEASFYRVLKQMMGEHLLIFPKVALKEFLFVTDKQNYQSHYNRIDRKHVDFLVCDPNTLQPVFAIELDDSSHRQANRGERDAFVDSALSVANLPLVHIPARETYNTHELGALFKNAIQKREMRTASQEKTNQVSISAENSPTCPNCGAKMVLRTAQKGKNIGEKFWGCPNYPQCKTFIKIT